MIDGSAYEKMVEMDKFYVEFKGEYPYSDHISLHIDPLPIDYIKEHFPKDSPYFRNALLYEHIIDVRQMQGLFHWRLVETPVEQILYEFVHNDYLYDKSDLYAKVYFKLRRLIKSMLGERGTGQQSLVSAAAKYRWKILTYIKKWVNSDDFKEQGSKMYAATIPHLFVYSVNGVLPVSKVNVYSMK
jgi:hypothetical protein